MPYCFETIKATSRMSMESSPKPSPYSGGERIDGLGLDLEIQRLNEQGGDFPLETDIGRGRRLLHERRFVGHRLGFRLGF